MDVSMTEESLESQNFIYGLAASPNFTNSEAGLCMAACATGLLRSQDSGRTWQSAYQSIGVADPVATTAVAISPDFSEDPYVFAGLPGGMLRSRDGQTGWETIHLPDPAPYITAFAFSPEFLKDGILFASTMEDGVLYSTDHGYHWVSWNFGLLDLNVYCMAISPNFSSDETLFVGTQTGIFRSTNAGRAWREVTMPFGFDTVLSIAISPNYAQDATLFSGTENQGLWKSTDGGDSWKRLAENAINSSVNAILVPLTYAKKPEILVLNEGTPMLSNDSGNTWEQWRYHSDEVTAVYAPAGFRKGAPTLVGLASGEIIRL